MSFSRPPERTPASSLPPAPSDANWDGGHPHRCTEGHHWQHTGPTAATCAIPKHQPESGNLPYVDSQDCPLCSGREELLIRGSHSHHCPVCEGDWTHEGRCLDGLVASCLWCFPKAESDPAPGQRRGPHIHYCPRCGQNWQHTAPCAAPLRVALSECSGCRTPGGQQRAQPSGATASSRARALQVVRDLVAALPVPVFLLAGGILLILLLTFSWTPSSTGPRESARVAERRLDTRPPASVSSRARGDAMVGPLAPADPAGRVVPPSTAPGGPVDQAAPPAGTRPRSDPDEKRLPERPAANTRSAQALPEPGGQPKAVKPRVDPGPGAAGDARATAPGSALPPPPREEVVAQRPPQPSDWRSAQPPEIATATRQPDSDSTGATPSMPPAGARAGGTEGVQAAPPPPREEPRRPLPSVSLGAAENAAGATGSSSIPGAPPAGLPRGGAVADMALGGGPWLVSRAAPEPPRWERDAAAPMQSLREPPAGAADTPRWDATSIAALARAVVHVRPSKHAITGRTAPAASGGERPGGQGRGSRGFIIDGQGYIVTNDQLVSGASSIEVTLHDGRTLPAAVVIRDALNDVAVLKVEATGLPVIALGDSRALAVGERVLVIGSRGGLDRSLTAATVRATGTATGGNLALDLTLRPEGAGGPLLNRLGQAVGIVQGGSSPAAGARTVTFAVPIDRVKPILRSLLTRPTAGLDVPQAR